MDKLIAKIPYKDKLVDISSLVGLYYTSKFTIRVLYWLQKNFLTFQTNLKKKYGDGWVLITGGSSGIGLALGKKFAKEGFKVLLISRNQDKLAAAKKAIEDAVQNATVKTVAFDFNREFNDNEIVDLKNKLSEYLSDISVLINNVGFIHRAPFTENPNDKIRSITNVNIRALVFMTKMVLIGMLKRDYRSLIIGIGSMAGYIRFNTRSLYASSKFFMKSFLYSIGQEYKDKIDTTCLVTGSVATELNPYKQPFRVSADDYANSAYKMVGKYKACTGHPAHELCLFFFWNSPGFFKNFYRNYLTNCNKIEE